MLPYGQMSLWGATVITNLMSAIPWIGQDIVEFIWGGFSVNNATLNRFFSLHFLLPFVLAGLALMHLISLHDTAGSNNPSGASGNIDKLAFAPYYLFKDTITIYIFFIILVLLVFFEPNILGDSENYVMANPMQTPPAIVPEWYLLPFYAILRSIPSKLVGVIAMFSAMLILLALALSDMAKLRGIIFKPFNKSVIFFFVANLILLLILGAKHVENPFIELGQTGTLIYFIYFISIVPSGTLLENILGEIRLVTENTIKAVTNSDREIDESDFLVIGTPEAGSLKSNMPLMYPPKPYSFSAVILEAGPLYWVNCPNCINVNVVTGRRCPGCKEIPKEDKPEDKKGDKDDKDKKGDKDQGTSKPENKPENTTENKRVAMKMVVTTLLFGLLVLACVVSLDTIAHSLNIINEIPQQPNLCDAPMAWGTYFQDSASPQMEALVELHDNIMFHLSVILFIVGWMLYAIIGEFKKRKIANKFVSHGTSVELIWTFTPGLILLFIAFTSFKLLYLIDEVSDVNMTFYIEGHQWYWSYQYPDFIGDDGDFIEYDSYLTPESDLQMGALRMLDVDERVVIPEVTHARFIVSSGDVIHSYACPSLGIKADAYPGRLNQASTLINRLGTYYGQCSEICGILHSSMPITIESVTLEKFLVFLWDK